MYIGSWKIDDALTFAVTTHSAATGAATDADSPPSYRVYEDETGTAILSGTMAKLDDSNTTGFYSEQITLSAANGFEKGKCYTIYISATVSSVTGTTERHFQIGAEVDVCHAAGTAWNSGAIGANTLAADTITAAKIANNAIDAGAITSDAIAAIQSGLATASALSSVDGKVDTIDSNVDEVLEDTGTTLPGTLTTIAGYIDTEIAAILGRLGAWTGSGRNTILGAFQALFRKDSDASVPSDINADLGAGEGAASNQTDSLEALRDNQQTAAAAALTAYDPPTKGELDSAVAPLALEASVQTIDGNVDAILEDTGTTLPGTLSTIAGYIDTEVAAIISAIAALNNISTAEVLAQVEGALTATIADSVPSDGDRPSISSGIYMLVQFLLERSVSGTTMTVKKPDGSTTLFTLTLNDATAPTAVTRSS